MSRWLQRIRGATVVKGSVLADKPVQSFESALAGRAAGVQITVTNGVVNAPPGFHIRGINSITQSSYPLIVVDGVASFTGDLGATAASTNPLASINPNDIESVTVAKDAAATAIYGSRAGLVSNQLGEDLKALYEHTSVELCYTSFHRIRPIRKPLQMISF